MTGRERVLKAYRHEEPDRTPIGEMYDIAPPTREVILGKPCGFLQRMEMLRDADWKEIVENKAQDIIDIAVKLGFDMIGVRPNISPNFQRPSPISKYKWKWGNTIYEYLPESGITRTYRTEKENSEKEEFVEQTKNPPPEPEFYGRALSEDEVKQNFKAKGFAAVNPAANTITSTWGEIKGTISK